MQSNYVPTLEIAADALMAILNNPNTNVRDSDLPDIAINHAKNLLQNVGKQNENSTH